jgi:hypothetical protein
VLRDGGGDESEPARTVLLGLDRAIAQAAEAVDHQKVNNGGDMVRDTRSADALPQVVFLLYQKGRDARIFHSSRPDG